MFDCFAWGVGFDLFGLGCGCLFGWGVVVSAIGVFGFVMVVLVDIIASLAGMVFRRVTLVFLCCVCFVVCLVYFSLCCCIVVQRLVLVLFDWRCICSMVEWGCVILACCFLYLIVLDMSCREFIVC